MKQVKILKPFSYHWLALWRALRLCRTAAAWLPGTAAARLRVSSGIGVGWADARTRWGLGAHTRQGKMDGTAKRSHGGAGGRHPVLPQTPATRQAEQGTPIDSKIDPQAAAEAIHKTWPGMPIPSQAQGQASRRGMLVDAQLSKDALADKRLMHLQSSSVRTVSSNVPIRARTLPYITFSELDHARISHVV